MRLGRMTLSHRDTCRPKHIEGCTARIGKGGGASAVPWDAARLLGLVQGQMGQLAIHRARPDGDGWDRAAFNVRVLAESSPLLLERNSVCLYTEGDNRTSIDLEKVLERHKIDPNPNPNPNPTNPPLLTLLHRGAARATRASCQASCALRTFKHL